VALSRGSLWAPILELALGTEIGQQLWFRLVTALCEVVIINLAEVQMKI